MGTLNVEGLSFRYPGSSDAALQDATLVVPDGGIFGLLGPNGAGKTTLISILAGQLRGAKGRIAAGGEALEAVRRSRPHFLGLVPQEYAFYPMLTCVSSAVCRAWREPGSRNAWRPSRPLPASKACSSAVPAGFPGASSAG
jgi:ABC-type multidrug transport system ATPase subunit